jgi:hypothetical protein
MLLGPRLRWKFFYSIEEAGARRGWSRSESYRQAGEGGALEPYLVQLTAKIQGVKKRAAWDRDTKRVLRDAR